MYVTLLVEAVVGVYYIIGFLRCLTEVALKSLATTQCAGVCVCIVRAYIEVEI